MTWWSPFSSSWVRMAPRPPGFSAKPRLASVMRVYVRFCLGYATIGSEHRYDWRSWKDCKAALGNSPPFQLHSFLVIAVSSAVNCAKFLTCVRKKLQSPRNCGTPRKFSGGEAFSTAFNLSDPGLTPSSVKRNPRYATFLLLKWHFDRLILTLCWTNYFNNWSSNSRCSL